MKDDYEAIRASYKPEVIRWLLIAESPPPGPEFGGSRHFYRANPPRVDDRLFVNTVKALYKDAEDKTEAKLEPEKERWLKRLQSDGVYMIEALEESQPHSATKKQRQERIQAALPRLIERIKLLTGPETKLVLIKSNPFQVASEPLKKAGFSVLNDALVDYPGQYNQTAFREKLRMLMVNSGWKS